MIPTLRQAMADLESHVTFGPVDHKSHPTLQRAEEIREWLRLQQARSWVDPSRKTDTDLLIQRIAVLEIATQRILDAHAKRLEDGLQQIRQECGL